ncbi:MAG TPA: valine--tRNA ligase [Candidatus Paceibacterota bacterium]
MSIELPKAYNPQESEDRIYALWEKSGFFNPDNLPERHKEPFSIILPPPNVTGSLHVGHAAMLAIEDIVIRFERMRGKKTLWLPGTDHAAIATQSKVEAQLYKQEKKTKHDLGREEFLKLVNDYAQKSHDTIVNQIKKMGASLDWSREAYTLDDKRSLAVRTAFKRMFDGGIIYHGTRIVNWDPKLQTTVSDDEIEWLEEKVPLYFLKYGPFTIATARPETKFGDKYVVVHPDDARYKEFKDGQVIELEWINGPIRATIIKDEAIDMEFGTGAMTITPWHDATDFDIAKRHNLDSEQIIDLKGILLPIAGEYAGMHIKKARPQIIERLKAKGLVEKVDETYIHRIATNSRGGGIIEPQVMKQWFIDVNKEFSLPHSSIKGIDPRSKTTLKKLMRYVVENGNIAVVPERFQKVYFHWIDNLRDWCISRQLWFGHRIPVWYRNDEIYCGIEPPKDAGWEQDPDTLDTWFSSGLWTFSTLGWPEETSDLKTYHPTHLLETGYDILFFWVARMVLMTSFLLGDIPFKSVYLHGLVRDDKGRKMSKSLENIIDPLDVIPKFGADALRLSLIIGAAPGNDSKISENKIKGYQHFANKLWNISRFVLMNLEGEIDVDHQSLKGNKHIEEFNAFISEITKEIEEYKFYLAGEKLYHYIWHTFADKIIEEHKESIKNGNEEEKEKAQQVLGYILVQSLKLLHPFVPFVTEAIYQHLPLKNKQPLLMIEAWPV